jgi:hypothetical protein
VNRSADTRDPFFVLPNARSGFSDLHPNMYARTRPVAVGDNSVPIKLKELNSLCTCMTACLRSVTLVLSIKKKSESAVFGVDVHSCASTIDAGLPFRSVRLWIGELPVLPHAFSRRRQLLELLLRDTAPRLLQNRLLGDFGCIRPELSGSLVSLHSIP